MNFKNNFPKFICLHFCLKIFFDTKIDDFVSASTGSLYFCRPMLKFDLCQHSIQVLETFEKFLMGFDSFFENVNIQKFGF